MENIHNEKRQWGEFTEYTHNSPSTVKILKVKKGEAISLQTHQKRDEFWHVLSGAGQIQIGEEIKNVVIGEDHFIPRQVKHRITSTTEDVEILEISSGIFEENDIYRIEDKYGRVN